MLKCLKPASEDQQVATAVVVKRLTVVLCVNDFVPLQTLSCLVYGSFTLFVSY